MGHSAELRKIVIKSVLEEGYSVQEACDTFSVSRSSIQRWRTKYNKTGNLSPKSREKIPYKLNNEELLNYINNNQDAYQVDIAEHFCVTPACISIAMKKLNITRKKSLRSTQKEMN